MAQLLNFKTIRREGHYITKRARENGGILECCYLKLMADYII